MATKGDVVFAGGMVVEEDVAVVGVVGVAVVDSVAVVGSVGGVCNMWVQMVRRAKLNLL